MGVTDVSCDEARRHFLTLTEGQSAPEGVVEHLRGCSACSRLLDEVRAARDLVRSLGPVAVRPGFADGVMARVATMPQRRPLPRWLVGPRAAVALSAAVVLTFVALTGLGLVLRASSIPEAPEALPYSETVQTGAPEAEAAQESAAAKSVPEPMAERHADPTEAAAGPPPERAAAVRMPGRERRPVPASAEPAESAPLTYAPSSPVDLEEAEPAAASAAPFVAGRPSSSPEDRYDTQGSDAAALAQESPGLGGAGPADAGAMAGMGAPTEPDGAPAAGVRDERKSSGAALRSPERFSFVFAGTPVRSALNEIARKGALTIEVSASVPRSATVDAHMEDVTADAAIREVCRLVGLRVEQRGPRHYRIATAEDRR